MSIIMYDSVNADSIPIKAKAVAGYIDGNLRSFPGMVRRFYPHAHCVSIGIGVGNLAEVTDVEAGNPISTPAEVRADFDRKVAHHVYRPCYYANHTDMENIVLPGLVGIKRNEYRLWLAAWDGDASVPAGYDAHQYSGGVSRPYDLSACRDDFFPASHGRTPISRVHPKVTASTIAGAITTTVLAILNTHGIRITHLTPAELGAVATAAAAIAGYVRKA